MQILVAKGVIQETSFEDEGINHLYGYVEQNPLILYDFDGLASKKQKQIAGGFLIICAICLPNKLPRPIAFPAGPPRSPIVRISPKDPSCSWVGRW